MTKVDGLNITGIYCRGCGKQLVVRGSKHTGYDKVTGEPTYKARFTCLDKRWFWDGHSSYTGSYKPKTDLFEVDYIKYL